MNWTIYAVIKDNFILLSLGFHIVLVYQKFLLHADSCIWSIRFASNQFPPSSQRASLYSPQDININFHSEMKYCKASRCNSFLIMSTNYVLQNINPRLRKWVLYQTIWSKVVLSSNLDLTYSEYFCGCTQSLKANADYCHYLAKVAPLLDHPSWSLICQPAVSRLDNESVIKRSIALRAENRVPQERWFIYRNVCVMR